MRITDTVRYVGVNDRKLDLFEGHYIVPNGMAYNSYLILGDKVAVTDTVGEGFGEEWLANISRETGGRPVDFLVVHHMEPDHSSNILRFAETYPEAKIAASEKAFAMMKRFYGTDLSDRKISLSKDGDRLSLGDRELVTVTAPMVHWPEVIMTYDTKDGVLFSADAFGKFGTTDTDEEWDCEARRYYFGIVGKYGAQVRSVLKKLSAYDIKAICPLHGPALTEDLDHYLGLYDIWSDYRPETDGVFIGYTSVYGHTAGAVKELCAILDGRGVKYEAMDLAREDMAEAVENSFRYSRIVFATTTYNMDVFPPMKTLLESLAERGYRNRKVALIENGTWAPNAAKVMRETLSAMKDITFFDTTVTISSAMDDTSREALKRLADELCG
jgi:flavorubredoxin